MQVYWVVYSLISVFETALGPLIRLIPLYYPFKLSFILWCYLPKFRGADVIYTKIIVPYFKQYESRIDEALRKVDKSIVK